jgi:hypothetical protein
LFYEDNLNILPIGIDEINEPFEISKILSGYNNNSDIFVCGKCHIKHFKSIIRHKLLNNSIIDNKKYHFNYKFIVDFYSDINLDFNVYYDFFKLNENETSLKLYEDVKHFKIIFTHTKSSNKEINIDLNDYLNNDKYLIICANKNIYDDKHLKHNVAKKFINIPIINYTTIIKNAKIIKVIDSCFACMILPLINRNILKTHDITIYNR